jgi:hypothetical protein
VSAHRKYFWRTLVFVTALISTLSPSSALADLRPERPVGGTVIWSDDSQDFSWSSDYGPAGDLWLATHESGIQVSRVVGGSYVELPANSFAPGRWEWTVCAVLGPATYGPCASPLTLAVKASPVLNQSTASVYLKSRIRKLWRGSVGIVTRCVRYADMSYSCNPSWRTKRSRFRAGANVTLIDHEWDARVYVMTRKPRK